MKKNILLLLTISSLFANLDIFTSISSDTIFVGDKIDLSVKVNKADFLDIEFPNLDVDNEDVTLETMGFNDSTLFLSLQFWKSGAHEFPSIKISYMNQAGIPMDLFSNPITLHVSDISEQIESNLRESKKNQNINLPFTSYQILLICLIVIFIIISYFLLIKRSRLYKSNDSFKKINLIEEALVEIDGLKLPRKMESLELEHFYISLSNIIKTYLRQKFFFNARKMTTSEILSFLQSNNIPIDGLKSLLKEADLCKFAKKKYEPTSLLKAKERTKALLYNFDEMAI